MRAFFCCVRSVIDKSITFIDMFAGIGGFREGLLRAGDFTCVGHCELDPHAERSYRALFDTEGEWYCADARQADPETMPEFDLLCGGFPCQAFSLAGRRNGFGDPRGTLFFELARLAAARHPRYLLFENVPGLLSHDRGRTFAAILDALDRLGYSVEWQVLNSKDFGVPQSRRRVYIVGYLDTRCRGKVFPFTHAAAPPDAPVTDHPGLPIKCATKRGYQLAHPGDSIDISYATTNTRRGRVGRGIAHTLTAGSTQGTLCFVDMNEQPDLTAVARCLTAKQNGGIRRHKREASGVFDNGRIRRLTPRECLRLQGWRDEQIDRLEPIQSDAQLYRQAGNGVTVTVVEAIGRRIAATDRELT